MTYLYDSLFDLDPAHRQQQRPHSPLQFSRAAALAPHFSLKSSRAAHRPLHSKSAGQQHHPLHLKSAGQEPGGGRDAFQIPFPTWEFVDQSMILLSKAIFDLCDPSLRMAVDTTTALIAVGMLVALAVFATFLYMLFQCTDRESDYRSESCPGSPNAQEPLRWTGQWPYIDENARRRSLTHSFSSPSLITPVVFAAGGTSAPTSGPSLSKSASTKFFLEDPETESIADP